MITVGGLTKVVLSLFILFLFLLVLKTNNEVKDLEQQLFKVDAKSMRNRFDELNTRTEGLKSAQDTLEQNLEEEESELSQSIASLTSRLESVTEKIDSKLVMKATQISEELRSYVSQEMTNLENRISLLEKSSKQPKNSSVIEDSVKRLSAKFTRFEEKLIDKDDFQNLKSSLLQKYDEFREQLKSLKGSLSFIESEIEHKKTERESSKLLIDKSKDLKPRKASSTKSVKLDNLNISTSTNSSKYNSKAKKTYEETKQQQHQQKLDDRDNEKNFDYGLSDRKSKDTARLSDKSKTDSDNSRSSRNSRNSRNSQHEVGDLLAEEKKKNKFNDDDVIGDAQNTFEGQDATADKVNNDPDRTYDDILKDIVFENTQDNVKSREEGVSQQKDKGTNSKTDYDFTSDKNEFSDQFGASKNNEASDDP
eukprot:TRINITY_DN1619_c0_g1_i1.p1 TRINITY_DN1619_c0_g1~~TRINITY_DN1619_c0_g1_i1.p1  ORF type:complete len:422 (+),score=92.54 TRINITY_DN1619_c0_g1_i1:69-1334(+)